MFPTLLDFDIQKQINQEHILKAALRRQQNQHAKDEQNGLKSVIVHFGAWLERVGCRLQDRFSPPSKLEIGSSPLKDAHLQQC